MPVHVCHNVGLTLLREWLQGGTGFCSELQVTIDASKLLDVASAIKHGHVLPWTKLRQYWAENPITNVGLFGLLVTTWAGFLSVREGPPL
jgi:hypothetical protein